MLKFHEGDRQGKTDGVYVNPQVGPIMTCLAIAQQREIAVRLIRFMY